MQTQQSKILITGSNGFVGKALNEVLIDRHFSVVCAMRKPATASYGKGLIEVGDINAHTDWSKSLEGVSIVIHLAARVHVMHDKVADPLAAFREVNLHGTDNLAKQAARAGVKRFVYVSSIKVNGEFTTETPFSENDDPHPADPYGVSKWEAEQALKTVSDETGMEVVIIRPPLIYGPGVKANFYNLLKVVSKTLPLPLNSIDNRRSMIYVGNLADALILCATHPQAAGKTYLVSDGEDVSTPALIKQLAQAMNRPCRLFSFPMSCMRMAGKLTGKTAVIDRLTQSLVVDSSRIRRELQWVAPYSIQKGLQATAGWYIQQQDIRRTE